MKTDVNNTKYKNIGELYKGVYEKAEITPIDDWRISRVHNDGFLLRVTPKQCCRLAQGNLSYFLFDTAQQIPAGPFTVYIYASAKDYPEKGVNLVKFALMRTHDNVIYAMSKYQRQQQEHLLHDSIELTHYIIGEFVCDNIVPVRVTQGAGVYEVTRTDNTDIIDIANETIHYPSNTQVTQQKQYTGYAGHIKDVLWYTEPKTLDEFTDVDAPNKVVTQYWGTMRAVKANKSFGVYVAKKDRKSAVGVQNSVRKIAVLETSKNTCTPALTQTDTRSAQRIDAIKQRALQRSAQKASDKAEIICLLEEAFSTVGVIPDAAKLDSVAEYLYTNGVRIQNACK